MHDYRVTMPITIIADQAEELAEPLRKNAKQGADGKWVVSALPDGWAIDDTGGLRKSLGSERAARKALAERLKEFGWVLSEDGSKWTEGIEPGKALSALEALKTGGLKSSKEIEDYKAEIAKQAEQLKATLGSERDRYRAQLEQTLVEQQAVALLAKHGGSKSLRALLPLVKAAARVEESADKTMRVSLYDEKGRQRFSQKQGANGAPMDLEEFVEELRGSQDLKALFEAKAAGGSGSTSQSRGSGSAGNTDSQTLSPRELIQRANEAQNARAGVP